MFKVQTRSPIACVWPRFVWFLNGREGKFGKASRMRLVCGKFLRARHAHFRGPGHGGWQDERVHLRGFGRTRGLRRQDLLGVQDLAPWPRRFGLEASGPRFEGSLVLFAASHVILRRTCNIFWLFLLFENPDSPQMGKISKLGPTPKLYRGKC